MGVTTYCTATPITLETIQYKDRPAGNCRENTAIITGIIHSIMVWLVCCFGSDDGIMVSFCWTQVETNTKAGMITLVGSGEDKSSPRNEAVSSAAE